VARSGEAAFVEPPKPWNLFLSYRREDGEQTAEWLYEALSRGEFEGREGQVFRLQPYFDKAAPSIGDFRGVLRPHLASSRAFLLVCTPGAARRRETIDFLWDEIDWWVGRRRTAPILVLPDGAGMQDIPAPIAGRWPRAQLVELHLNAWSALEPVERAALERRSLDQILRGIEISERGVRFEELERERKLNRRLRFALGAVALATVAAVYLANDLWHSNTSLRRSLAETRAKGYFASISAADLQVHQREYEGARSRLRQLDPDLRAWEWRFLDGLVDRSVQSFALHSRIVQSVDLLPDGSKAVTASLDGTSCVVALDECKVVARWSGDGTPLARVRFTPDGARVVIGDRHGGLFVWTPGAAEESTRRQVHEGGILDLILSRDGRTAYTCGDDRTLRATPLDDASAEPRTVAKGVDMTVLAAMPGEGSLAATTLGGQVCIVRLATGSVRPIGERDGDIGSGIAVLEQGATVASSTLRGAIALRDAESGELRGGVRLFDPDEVGSVNALVAAAGGALLIAGDSHPHVQVWRAGDGRLTRFVHDARRV
jgi:hypothetical protein